MTDKRFEYIMFDGFFDNEKEEYLDNHEVAKLLNRYYKMIEGLPEDWTKLIAENIILESSNKEYEDALARLEEENDDLLAEQHRLVSLTAETISDFQKKILDILDEKIEKTELDLEHAVKGGMPTSELYSEIDLLEEIKEMVRNG